MANLKNYSPSILGLTTLSTHDIRYVGQVVDDQGNVLGDFSTGTTLLTILNTLTTAQGLEFADVCAQWLLKTKFPSAFP